MLMLVPFDIKVTDNVKKEVLVWKWIVCQNIRCRSYGSQFKTMAIEYEQEKNVYEGTVMWQCLQQQTTEDGRNRSQK